MQGIGRQGLGGLLQVRVVNTGANRLQFCDLGISLSAKRTIGKGLIAKGLSLFERRIGQGLGFHLDKH
jgi:hypothetical protein